MFKTREKRIVIIRATINGIGRGFHKKCKHNEQSEIFLGFTIDF